MSIEGDVSNKSVEEVKKEEPEVDPEFLDEVDLEDKVFCVNPVSDSCKIWVFHQAASRWLRKDIITQMKKNIRDLEGYDLDELTEKVETHAI
jgi:Fe-S-cluster formation regulator IscX/YfhJ